MDCHGFVSHDLGPQEMIVDTHGHILLHQGIRATLQHEVALPYLDLYRLAFECGKILVKPGVERSDDSRVQRYGILRAKPRGQQDDDQQ